MPEEKTELWGIVEVMGRRVYAGRISEHVLGGATFVRVDVPASGDIPEFTKMFGGQSIYCLTPTTEAVARRSAAQFAERPVNLYDLPAVRRIGASQDFEQFDDEHDEPDDDDPMSYLERTHAAP